MICATRITMSSLRLQTITAATVDGVHITDDSVNLCTDIILHPTLRYNIRRVKYTQHIIILLQNNICAI